MCYESLERNLFTLSMSEAFSILNSSQTSEHEVDRVLDSICSGLFSVLLTIGGQCPVICASRGTAAGIAGSKLEKKIRSHLTNIQSNIIGESNLNETSRPRKNPLIKALLISSVGAS